MAKTYNPIPKIGTGRLGFQVGMRNRLYQGPDHLLIVQSTGYTEEYKRIAYPDIRYLMVMETYGQTRQGMASGAIILLIFFCHLFGLPWLAVGLMSTPFLVWFAANIMLGPSCRCYLNTHVQTVQLPAPRRMKKVPVLRAFLQSQIPSPRPASTEQPVA
jgi:hypothetical protein